MWKHWLCWSFGVMLYFGSAAQRTPLLNPSNCGLGIPIPDVSCNSTNRFPIRVQNANGTRLGMDVFLDEVRLIITHGWLADLDISLISPSGKIVILSTDNGADQDNYGDPSDPTCGTYISFSMSACRAIEGDTVAPFIGAYRPEGNLADLHDGTDPNGIWFIQICDDAEEDIGFLEFVELVFGNQVCFAPSNVQLLDLDSTTIKLTWEAGSNCNSTIIEYGPVGFIPGAGASALGGTTVAATCPPFNLLGLAENTTYEIYVRERCGTNNFSDNTCPIVVRTGTNPPPISLIETFDNQARCVNICGQPCLVKGTWRNAAPPANFDWLVEEGATATSNTGPSDDANGGGRYAYIETSGSFCRNGRVAHLQSNCIEVDTTGSRSQHFSYNYHLFGSTIGSLQLQISENGGLNWQTIWQKAGNQGDRWFKEYINLSAWHRKLVQFRFVGVGGTSATGDIALDNLIFYGSRDMGEAIYVYYADADGDGFGNPNQRMVSCYATAPMGFVENNLDCNDTNANINPNATEIPCNGVDENCNGMEDDSLLPPPATTDATVCANESATVFAIIPQGGFVLWFGSADGEDFLRLDNDGSGYSRLVQAGTDSIVVFAESYVGFNCKSSSRSQAIIRANPLPKLQVGAIPNACTGEAIRLDSIKIIDQANLGGLITFHTALPATVNNQLTNLAIQPTTRTTYYALSTTVANCKATAPIVVEPNQPPQVRILPSVEIGVCANSSQTITASPLDGRTYTYRWSNGTLDNRITVESNPLLNAVDRYTLTVTDANGCEKIDTVAIRTTAGIQSARISPTEVSTCGGDDGTILVEPLGGTMPFTYTWEGTEVGRVQNVEGSFRIPALSQGTYKISVTDNSPQGCSIQLPFTVVNGPSAKVNVASMTMPTCTNSRNGSICLNVSGISPQIIWSNGNTTACLENVAAGKYSVTVTDGTCATTINDIELLAPTPINISTLLTPPSCSNSRNGAIRLTTSGGTMPYTHFWNDGINFESRQQLSAGSYFVSIVDANNCTFSDTISLSAPEELTISTAVVSNISCTPANDGSIVPIITGGTTPYFYEWNNQRFTNILTNLSEGNYSLTVTDANNCKASGEFKVTRPSPLEVRLDTLVNASCAQLNDGRIRLSAFGGTGNYTFRWSNNRNSAEISNLRLGTYAVTVSDQNGCTVVRSFQVTAPPALRLSSEIKAPTCEGSQDGAINLALEGTELASILWSNGASSQNLSNIAAGDYKVIITDQRGCVLDTTYQVKAPQAINANIVTIPPSCHNSSDGSIQVSVTNQTGLAPNFIWSNGSRQQNLSGLTNGQYQVSISDSKGCRFVSDTIAMLVPAPISIEMKRVSPVQCAGDSNGSIEIEINGGRAPYTFSWNTGATTKDLFDIQSGLYRLAVLDQNGCAIQSELIFVEQPEPIQIDVKVIQNEPCQLERNQVDSIVLTAKGGKGSYDFLWSNGATSPILTNVVSGSYNVTVSDQNSCASTVSAIKVKPSAGGFAVKASKRNATCAGRNDGTILAAVQGGTAPYLYHLSNGTILLNGLDSLRFSNLSPGNYQLSITDNEGCFNVVRNILIAQPEALNILLEEAGLQNVSCKDGRDGFIKVEVNGGKRPYQFTWRNQRGEIVGKDKNLTNIGAGEYLLTVRDENGCEITSRNFIVREPLSSISFTNLVITDARCFGENSGGISVNVVGGAPPYRFSWNNGQYTTRNLPNIPNGQYRLQVTDQNGCIARLDSVIVRQANAPIQIQESVIRSLTCFGTNDGSIRVQLQGGLPPYSLLWQSTDIGNNYINGDTTFINQLRSGNYQLLVTDSVACQRMFNFNVTSPDILELTGSSIPSPREQALGAVQVTAKGGTAPYRYTWSVGGSPNAPNLMNLPIGIYTVTVTDVRGCTANISIEVKEDTGTTTKAVVPTLAFTLQPNPTNGQIYLLLPEEATIEEIHLYSNLGQWLHSWKVPSNPSIISVDLSDFSAGIYWLQVRTLTGTIGVRNVMKVD